MQWTTLVDYFRHQDSVEQEALLKQWAEIASSNHADAHQYKQAVNHILKINETDQNHV